MSDAVKALNIKIKWQLNQLLQKQSAIDDQIEDLKKQTQDTKQKITAASAIPATLLPEQEIARSHFILLQQQQQNQRMTDTAALLDDKCQLELHQTQLNTQLKILEKYQDAKKLTIKHQAALIQQSFNDEWVLQNRGEL